MEDDRHFTIEVDQRTGSARITGTRLALEDFWRLLDQAIKDGMAALGTVNGREIIVRRED